MTQSDPKSNPTLSAIAIPISPLHHKALTPEKWQVQFNKDKKIYIIVVTGKKLKITNTC